MKISKRVFALVGLMVGLSLACKAVTFSGTEEIAPTPLAPVLQDEPPTPLPPIPVEPGEANPDEPVFISGEIPYTSPFFVNSVSQPFVMLEDQAGFVKRDREFQFSLSSQIIGAAELHSDGSLVYSLSLPAIPQGTQLDLDNDAQADAGVQVFAVAYWSNTWGDPFLEERDGTGWSTAYASTITDPENEDEIKGGILIVWAPDDQQSFPTSFGEDGKLFTEDDPAGSIAAGYNLVDLSEKPFRIWKEARPGITLNEGEGAVNDYSSLSYSEAFETLFAKASREYPFTEEKKIDWQALHDQFAPRFKEAKNDADFYRAIRDFTWAIPDSHVGVSFNADVFYEDGGGSFGVVLAELSDQTVIVTRVIDGSPAEKAGIQTGAQIITWNSRPVGEAISAVVPYFGPFSTEHARRLSQVAFLTRVPVETKVTIAYKNPGSTEKKATMQAEAEYESLQAIFPNNGLLDLPIEGKILDDSGLGYIRISTFNADYNLMARLWEHYIQNLIDNGVPGLILDIRQNSGGSTDLAHDFAGYFFDEEFTLYNSFYYNENSAEFELTGLPSKIEPGPRYYDGPIALLVSPDCVSACEGFAYAMIHDDRAIVVGHYPTAGAYGEVGRGQYKLPGDLSLQMPTGRSEALDGSLVLEGEGVVPSITVPVTADSALGKVDAVLDAAIQALLDKIR